jgi:hypothetical protein
VNDNKFFWVLQSRKFWAAVVGFVSILWVAYQSGTTLDPDTVINAILGIVAAYIAATAYEDGKHAEAAGRMATSETTTVSTPSDNVTITTEGKTP